MEDNNSKGISYISGFFLLISFFVAGALLGGLISIPVWMWLTGESPLEIGSKIGLPQYSTAAKWLQSISAIFGFLLPAYLAAFLLNKKPLKLLGFTKPVQPINTAMVVAIMVTMLVLSPALSYLTELIPLSKSLTTFFKDMENVYLEQVKNIVNMKSFGDYIIALIVMALLPAICEETYFRGGLQNFLSKKINPNLAILIVSILFSAAHFSYYGFLSRVLAGMVLGYIFYFSKNIWLNIIGHFLNNAIAVTVVYVALLKHKTIEEALAESANTLWGLLALPVLIGLL